MISKNLAFVFSFAIFVCFLNAQDKKSPKKKKDLTDYNDADLERLFEEWEEKDEPLEEDELPEWKKQPPKIDLSKIDVKNPEAILQMSKKGRTLMMFVSVTDNPDQNELEEITRLWQTSLYNAHIDCQRFVVDTNRVIFMFQDGAKAWEAKTFFVEQDRCLEVTIEGKSYPGKKADQIKKTEL